MSDQFVAEIRMFAGDFAPNGWALCNGQLMPIQQNTALFSLVGTYYGGDGRSTFGLPNLQGCSPVGPGQGPGLPLVDLGEQGGVESVTLIQSELPMHTHLGRAVAADGSTGNPSAASWAVSRSGRASEKLYGTTPGGTMSPATIGYAGGGLPHPNLAPYLVVNFIIALQGIFPARG